MFVASGLHVTVVCKVYVNPYLSYQDYVCEMFGFKLNKYE